MIILKDLIAVVCKNYRSKEYFQKEEYKKLIAKENDLCVICIYRSPSFADIYRELFKQEKINHTKID